MSRTSAGGGLCWGLQPEARGSAWPGQRHPSTGGSLQMGPETDLVPTGRAPPQLAPPYVQAQACNSVPFDKQGKLPARRAPTALPPEGQPQQCSIPLSPSLVLRLKWNMPVAVAGEGSLPHPGLDVSLGRKHPAWGDTALSMMEGTSGQDYTGRP